VITVRHHPRRRGAPALAVLGVLLVAAACSSTPSSSALPDATGTSGAAPSASASVDPQDAMLEYARCMRDHGVDAPDPVDGNLTVDGRGLTPEQMEAAESACAKWQQAMEPQDGGRELTEEEKQAFLDQAQCMRDRGWNVSDPEFDGGRVTQKFHKSPDGADAAGDPKPGDPAFEKDLKECADEAGVKPPENDSTGTGGA
jgi:hypothetical protein